MSKVVALFVWTSVAGLMALGQTSDRQPPDVGAEFQKSISTAWSEAVSGTSSSKACAGLKGSLHGRIRYQGQTDLVEKAAKAIQACEVDIPVRYFETYLDGMVAKKHTCRDFMSHFETEMGGIGMRPTSLEDMEPKEPRTLILTSLAERIQKDCPDVAPWMLKGIGG